MSSPKLTSIDRKTTIDFDDIYRWLVYGGRVAQDPNTVCIINKPNSSN